MKFVLLGDWWNEALFLVAEGTYLMSHLRVGFFFDVH